MNKIVAAAALIVMLFFISACGPSEADLANTEVIINSTSQAQSTNTMSVRLTSEFANTAQAGTSQASTETMAFEEAQQQNVENTQAAKTQQAFARETEKAADIFAIVQALYEAGHISRTAGSYQRLPNFSDTWKVITRYENHIIEDSFVSDFVLLVNFSWDSVNQSEVTSGCGISFRGSDNSSEFYAFALILDGTMKFVPKVTGADSGDSSSVYWGDLDSMENSATFIVTAEGTTFQVFNEQLEMVDIRYGEELRSGNLAYYFTSAIESTDNPLGCSFSNSALWRLED